MDERDPYALTRRRPRTRVREPPPPGERVSRAVLPRRETFSWAGKNPCKSAVFLGSGSGTAWSSEETTWGRRVTMTRPPTKDRRRRRPRRQDEGDAPRKRAPRELDEDDR